MENQNKRKFKIETLWLKTSLKGNKKEKERERKVVFINHIKFKILKTEN